MNGHLSKDRVTAETAHAYGDIVMNPIYSHDLSEHGVKKILEHGDVIGVLLAKILKGEVEIDSKRMTIRNMTGLISLS